jgi:hypothetical protein
MKGMIAPRKTHLWKMSISTATLLGALAIGWIPLFLADLFYPIKQNYQIVGFGLAWGIWITTPTTLLAVVIICYKVYKAFFRRPKPGNPQP